MIAWFARNGVAANLLMFIVVAGGLLALPRMTVELMPEMSLDQVQVRIAYPGATPVEVEEAVILRVEEAVQSVRGIRQMSSIAAEHHGSVLIEAQRGYDVRRLKEDIKTRVDAITTFPREVERPIVEELIEPRNLLYVAIAGDADEATLRRAAERVRDDIVALPNVSQAELVGGRDFEIAVEVSEQALRKFGMTFDEVATAVQRWSIDIPGGSIHAHDGEILLRTVGQAYVADEFAQIPLRTDPGGIRVTLGDVARINDGFTDRDAIISFDGKPAAIVLVQQASEERPADVSRSVNAYLDEAAGRFPEGITLTAFIDRTFYLSDRIALLVKNGAYGLILVVLLLAAFLRPMLAVLVAIGIPVSFLGTLLIAPHLGVSINMISLFAFILVLGIIVDDAIVTGESVFTEYRRRGFGTESAIRGTHQVAMPVTFAVLTTMVAFLPLFFLPGTMGKSLYPIPVIVIATLAWSLVQSKLVLPYHLSLIRRAEDPRSAPGTLAVFQRRLAGGLEWFIDNHYRPVLEKAVAHRYITLSVSAAALILSIGVISGGWVRFVPTTSVPSDFIIAEIEYPMGTPIETTRAGLAQMHQALHDVIAEIESDGHPRPVRNEAVFTRDDTHHAVYLLELHQPDLRALSATELTARWRAAIGDVPGIRSLVLTGEAGATSEQAIDIQLAGRDTEEMQRAARAIRERLVAYPSVINIADNFTDGKRDVRLNLRTQAQVLGLSVSDLGQQIRHAFFGAEAQRIQRGRNDVRVMVRYPREERESLEALDNLRVRLPDGGEVALPEVAELEMGRGFATIHRVNRQRVLNITADIDRGSTDYTALVREIRDTVLPAVLDEHEGVQASMEGEAAETDEVIESLLYYGVLMLFIIYALLAVPLRSYIQPLIVMAAIPFALVGAVFGHMITHQSFSILSALGLIAAFGVVVNASLVLVDFVNRYRGEGADRHTAIIEAGAARFRPVLLTSLTTFIGLTPLLLERSLQAQLVIPMATSLAFGVLFASLITLLLVPALYLAIEDIKSLSVRLLGIEGNQKE